MEKEFIKPTCPIVGTEGNVFALAEVVQRTLHNAGHLDKAKEFSGKLFDCSSAETYDAVLELMAEYVEIE